MARKYGRKKMKDKLKPCPFCGFRAFAHKMPKIDGYRAYCGNEDCDIQPQTRLCYSREEAVEIWNKRVENER